MGTRVSHPRTFLGFRWAAVPRDFLARRRWFRRFTDILLIVLLSVFLAGIILYTSGVKPH
ncbi:MAG TPA: hypothetical protein VGF20_06375 [Candidatus Acidoferrum sp.]